MKRRLNIYSYTPIQLFCIISITGSILFILYSVIFGRMSFSWMTMENDTNHAFLDYFEHVLYTIEPSELYKNATGEWGCFPPCVYIIYRMLYKMTSLFAYAPTDWRALAEMDEALTVFLYYSIVVIIITIYAIQNWGKKHGGIKLIICLMLSAPFFAGYERGNSIMLVLPLLLLALKWKDSDSPIKREAALIIIAISAGIKIYPAIFGLIYIKERRFKETLRLIVYGIVILFVPFLFFGGINGFLLWLNNVSNTMVTYSVGRIEYIKGVVSTISYLIIGSPSEYLSLVVPNLFLIFMITLYFISTDKYRSVFFLCAIMTFYPANAFRYTLCYLSIPLVMYLMEHGDERIKDKNVGIELIAYGLLYTVPTLFGFFTNFRNRFSISIHLTYVELRLYVVAYFILISIIILELIDILQHKKFNKMLFKKIEVLNK